MDQPIHDRWQEGLEVMEPSRLTLDRELAEEFTVIRFLLHKRIFKL